MSPAAHALKYPIQVFVFPLENAINVKEALKHKREHACIMFSLSKCGRNVTDTHSTNIFSFEFFSAYKRIKTIKFRTLPVLLFRQKRKCTAGNRTRVVRMGILHDTTTPAVLIVRFT